MNNFKQPDTSQLLTPKERRQRNREEVIASIVATARAIMRQDGVAALNLHELARRIGMRTSSLYEYFPGKLAIYDALFQTGVRLYHKEIQRLLKSKAEPMKILQEIFSRYMSLALENPELYQLVFERPVPGFVPSEASIKKMLEMQSDMSTLLNRVRKKSGKNTIGSEFIPDHGLIIAIMHGMTALQIANDPKEAVGKGRFGSLIDDAVNLFIDAWGNTR